MDDAAIQSCKTYLARCVRDGCTALNHHDLCDKLLSEIERLRAGGCARDQHTTQFCAEAVAAQQEIERLRSRLAVYEPEDAVRLLEGVDGNVDHLLTKACDEAKWEEE